MDINQELNKARSAAIKNKRKQARAILRKLIEQHPRNVDAWLLFAEVAQYPEDALRCLDRVLKIDPGNETAARKRAYMLPPSPQEIRPAVQVELGVYDLHQRLGLEGEDGAEYDLQVSDDFQQSVADPGPFADLDDDGNARAEKNPVWDFMQSHVPAESSDTWQEQKQKRGRLESVLLVALIGMTALCVISLACALLFPKSSPLASAGGGKTQSMDDYTAVVVENLRASNAEEIDAYMATIHSRSPLYDQTEASLSDIFQNYDLSYHLDKLELMDAKPAEIQLAFELTTVKLRGPGFRDNTIKGVMILRQEGGQWKIYDQQVDQVEYLN